MTDRKSKRQRICEVLEENIDEHIHIVEDVISIFSKIEADSSAFEEFKAILLKISYLEDHRETILKFDRYSLHEIAGKLGNLRTALNGIKTHKR